jgi:hypothetical protein
LPALTIDDWMAKWSRLDEPSPSREEVEQSLKELRDLLDDYFREAEELLRRRYLHESQ